MSAPTTMVGRQSSLDGIADPLGGVRAVRFSI